jgi:uncharacterized surface protein with fasciclin (FAS1) repeats
MALSLLFSSHIAFASNERLKTDIVDTAVASGSFNTLVAAVKAADLVAALKSPGPFTVLAPTDSAFAKLPYGSLEFLLANKETLTKVLTYHVADAEFRILDFPGSSFTTLQGQLVKISRVGHDYFVNEAKILNIIKVKNGQIVVIDSLLRPF